jgi:ATP-dependent HslUV protease, peptidase subunit HslV
VALPNESDAAPRPRLRATTILGVKRDGAVALAGDGQVTLGDVVLKHGARKIRTLYDGQILAGFAGAVADGLTLFGKFESQLKAWDGNLRRASVELAKEWRTDRYLRRLEASLIVADPDSLLVLSGDGDVIEPDDGIVAIGSGAPYATAAAKALVAHTDLDARAIVESAMGIAANLCIFTNDHFSVETVRRAADGTTVVGHGTAADRELPVADALPPATDPAGDEDDDDSSDDEEGERDADRDEVDDAEDDEDRDAPW